TSGLISKRMRWVMKYKCAIKIVEDESLGVVEARYYDKTGFKLTSDTVMFDNDLEDIEKESADTL
ncbi:MAG: hypothetical protein R3Y26_07730, partial [Rikenellaceae bacterium]